MSVAAEKELRGLRILWASHASGLLRMTWVDASSLVGRVRQEVEGHGG